MKLGDALHLMWANGRSTNVHRGLTYELGDNVVIGLNDLRAIWEYLNQDIPLEGTLKEASSGKRAAYISEDKRVGVSVNICKGMTNGDVIKGLFKGKATKDYSFKFATDDEGHGFTSWFDAQWWDAPYEKEGE